MFKIFSIALALGALSLGVAADTSFAKSGKKKSPQGFQVYDAETGDEIYNDGKMDGKACAVGREVKYDPITGKFKKVPAVKCNF